MPGYLVDEGGERTHAVVPIEEYERLTKATEQLVSVRGYVSEILAVINNEAQGTGQTPQESGGEVPQGEAEPQAGTEQRGYGWS